ncbi:MAG: ribosomal protein S18-alanine N-acetyltransferase [Oscillospiraceae bacterium]|nr:ribosomal protein S18-alanine N-acetyltransferase [Oscillospiraceae bacterium]
MNLTEKLKKLEQLEKLETLCFKNPWSLQAIKTALESEYSIVVFHDDGSKKEPQITGYALGTRIADECELHRICVLPEHRNRRIGELLLREFIHKCKERNQKKIFLEVASKNKAAIKLYERCGFKKIAVREGYYGDDDGVCYWLGIGVK